MGIERYQSAVLELWSSWPTRMLIILLAALLLGLVLRALWRRITRVSLDDNAMMAFLLDQVRQQRVETLFFNSYVACVNFSLRKVTTTNTKVYTDGSTYDSSSTSYEGQLHPDGVLDFNKMGYKRIPGVEVRQYRQQMYQRMMELPCVLKVERYHMDSFSPESLFVSRGRHEKSAWGAVGWLIEYKDVSKTVPELANGRYIG